MYILSQDRKVIVNTDNMKGVYSKSDFLSLGEIGYQAIGVKFNCWQSLGIYHSGERANEVLQHIFRALKNKEVTFEMPEV